MKRLHCVSCDTSGAVGRGHRYIKPSRRILYHRCFCRTITRAVPPLLATWPSIGPLAQFRTPIPETGVAIDVPRRKIRFGDRRGQDLPQRRAHASFIFLRGGREKNTVFLGRQSKDATKHVPAEREVVSPLQIDKNFLIAKPMGKFSWTKCFSSRIARYRKHHTAPTNRPPLPRRSRFVQKGASP